jgi:phage-related protein
MATLNYLPDWGASKAHKPRVNLVQFGDGYEQRGTDGLNTNMETWTVTFVRIPETIRTIDSFLKARNGVEAFNWTTPEGRSAVFKCSDWTASKDTPGKSTLTGSFVEVPEVVAA